ncbi:hypothetical protein HY945_03635 [Candidatus Gottesmanbacteria bacterium]|nr:hypothetical protein [Candidatus Gottesmanbacteria bacterium]
MNKNHHFHILHYLFLIFFLALGITSFFYYSGYPDNQFFIAMATSLFYFIWGIVHHALEGDLHPKVMVEYLVISLLAILLLRGAIYR